MTATRLRAGTDPGPCPGTGGGADHRWVKMAGVISRDRLRVAARPMTESADDEHNRDVAERLVRAAPGDEAGYMAPPETWNA